MNFPKGVSVIYSAMCDVCPNTISGMTTPDVPPGWLSVPLDKLAKLWGIVATHSVQMLICPECIARGLSKPKSAMEAALADETFVPGTVRYHFVNQGGYIDLEPGETLPDDDPASHPLFKVLQCPKCRHPLIEHREPKNSVYQCWHGWSPVGRPACGCTHGK